MVSSASAFVDDGLLAEFKGVARRCGSQLVLSPGAGAGIEALAAASRLGIHAVRHRIVKPSKAWGRGVGSTLGEAVVAPMYEVLFDGSAREAARRFPLNANVTWWCGGVGRRGDWMQRKCN